jgi:hypothetical protein
MNKKPIIFSTEMVRAILAGKKTITRRVMKPQPILRDDGYCCWKTPDRIGNIWREGETPLGYTLHKMIELGCPFGKVGDLLWVRESWGDVTAAFDDSDELRTVAFKADNSVWDCYGQMVYLEQLGVSGIEVDKWKPSIHLPKFASRLSLEIKNIRVERLQDISADDALAEGISKTEFWKPNEVDENPKPVHEWKAPFWDDYYFWTHYPQIAFSNAWDKINGKRKDCSWESNPWVWVLEFRAR